MLFYLAPRRGARVLLMGAAQLVLFSIVVMGLPPCNEAQLSETTECEAIPDSGTAGASLIQSRSVTSTLGESAAAAVSDSSAGASSPDVSPSLSLLQAFSSGSGTEHFTAPRRHSAHVAASMMSLSRKERLVRSNSTIFYLVPVGVSLAVCIIILSLIYCIASTNDRTEDESLSRVLGGINPRLGKQSGRTQNSIQAKVSAMGDRQRPQALSSTASVSTSASIEASPAPTPPEEASDESATEAPSADEVTGLAAPTGDTKVAGEVATD